MRTSLIRLKAFEIIKGSKNLTPSSRIQLFEFIKNADKYQLMSLMLDGKIRKIDKQSRDILEDRFNTSKIAQIIIQEGRTASIMGLIFNPVLWAIWRLITAEGDEVKKRCSSGPFDISKDRYKCMDNAHYWLLRKKVDFFKKSLNLECPKHKNPDKCKKKALSLASNMNKKADKALSKFRKKYAEEPKKPAWIK